MLKPAAKPPAALIYTDEGGGFVYEADACMLHHREGSF